MVKETREWKDGKAKEITFIVTKDCQLDCKYCYLVGKTIHERMSWETAKATIDYILEHENDSFFSTQSVIFDFIGGEPLLEIDLINRICDYIKLQMYKMGHHWFDSYRFSLTTNGINYHSEKVQNFIRKNRKHLSITITIDGTQKKHDLNRIWKDSAKGSYEDVVKNIPLWLKQFPNAATKVTISSPDIPYIKESVLHLFSLGIHSVHINCVFENVWKDGDDLLFEQQLTDLADTIIENRLYEDYECSFFQRGIGQPMDAVKDNSNWCGAGKMLSVDAAGVFYPCTRFAQYSLREKKARTIGSISTGLDRNKIRAFDCLNRTVQSSKECLECEVAKGCAWCQGENYDCADSPTIFQRSTAICKMHKARVRANNYFWKKIDGANTEQNEKKHIVGAIASVVDKSIEKPSTIIVLLDSAATSFCHYQPSPTSRLLSKTHLQQIIKHATDENLQLQFVYPNNKIPEEYLSLIERVPHKDIIPFKKNCSGDAIVINDWNEIENVSISGAFYILRTSLADFCSYVEKIDSLLCYASRVNIELTDELSLVEQSMTIYKDALEKLMYITLRRWKPGAGPEVNVITDRLYLRQMSNCNAGWKSITLAPNGKFYVCPAFYYNDENDSCGSLESGIDIKNPLLYKLSHAPLCSDCNAYQCQRCIYINKHRTLEVNIPSYEQCEKSKVELEITRRFYTLWKEHI